ncbi:MAG: NAD(P)/FAD-dependent oxidoreductase, partial [Blastocatellia bacterium]
AVIVATGVRRRKLGVEGEDEFAGKGIIESGTRDRDSIAGKSVLIVGGGDAALENALILAEVADKVTVANRSLHFRARDEFLASAKANTKIALIENMVVESFEGNTLLESVTLKNTATGETRHIPIEAALIRIGVMPNSELLKSKVHLDPSGYILVNQNGETGVSGIFAVGDISNPTSLTITTAVGTGSAAAKAIQNWLKTKSGVYSKRLRIPNI